MKAPDNIFFHDEEVYNTKAAEIIIPLIMSNVKLGSVLDVGCGNGTWLKVFQNEGVEDFYGIESHYIDQSKMQIPSDKYQLHDLNSPIFLNKQYDLVISLEVAEHLKENAADTFIETLVKHGKTVLFSAAIPGQGGQNHLNEQWPKFWQEKFQKHGYYYYDIIRPKIWRNEKVDIWYRQNIFLVKHKSLYESSAIYNDDNLVHPEHWTDKVNNEKHLKNEIDNLEIELSHWVNGRKSIINFILALKMKAKNKFWKIFKSYLSVCL